MSTAYLDEARARIQSCHRRRRNHLNLAELGLSTADLEAIPEFAQLMQLEFLDLTGNELTQLPDGLSSFTRLRWLGLNFNRLLNIGPVIYLENLERLYVRGNELAEVPTHLAALKRLVELDLHGNHILSLPVEFRSLLDDEHGLYLDLGNNGGQLSQQFEAADGMEAKRAALRAYLKDVVAGTEELHQGKLLLVGEGGVGKSTLLSVLRGDNFVVGNDTTHGLEMKKLQLTTQDGWAGELHCWDFSGQPAMRQTHQLFFTHPALYLLVWNHREAREAETTAEILEWLTMIDQRTEGQGRVLMVVKKAEGRDATPYDFAEILRRFGPEAHGGRGGILLADPCVKVNSVCDVEMGTKGVPEEERKRRLAEAAEQVTGLRARIAAFCAKAPNFNEEVPKGWLAAQDYFSGLRLDRPYIPWAEFRNTCLGFNITDPDSYVRTQHRIGTLVWAERLKGRHARDEATRDKQLVVLNPDWLSKAVGYIIERDEQRQNRLGAEVPASPQGFQAGLVSAAQMDAIWRDPPVGRNQGPLVFDEDLFDFFREVMEGYDICREVYLKDGKKERWYVVPNRLPETRPAAWEKTWPQGLPELYWRVELRVPSGNREANRENPPLNHWLGRAVFFRLMVILHEHAQGRQNFAEAAHWRGGFILAPEGGGMARVVYNGSDRADAQSVTGFDLHVAAHAVRELWHVFSQALEYLLRDLRENYDFAEIRVSRKVSCPTHLCSREPAQRYFMDDLVLQSDAQPGLQAWENQTTKCNLCGKNIRMGDLWDGRTGAELGILEKIEHKLDAQGATLARVDQRMALIARQMPRLVVQTRSLMHQVLEAGKKLDSLDAALREEMASLRESMHAEMRRMLETLQDGQDDLPRLYTLIRGPKRFLRRRKWRLRLHCERTFWPVCLVDPDGKGEFEIKEQEPFLKAVAPYIEHVSTALVAVGGLTALLGSASLPALLPAAVTGMFEWAKTYSKDVEEISKLIKERGEANSAGLQHTGERVVWAEGPALQALHDFIRSQPKYESKLGLIPKADGHGRRTWVLPSVQL